QLPQEDEGLQAPEHTRQPAQQAHEEEWPQAPERAPQPEAAQPTGVRPLPGQALQEQIAQALRPVLGELRQRIVQAPQPVEQGRPEGQRREEQAQEEEQPQAPERAPQPQDEEWSQAPERPPQPEAAQNPAPARVLDEEARTIAELKQPG